jgi:hypothetical protein
MDFLKNIGWKSVDWIDVAQDTEKWRDVNALINYQIIKIAGNFLTS